MRAFSYAILLLLVTTISACLPTDKNKVEIVSMEQMTETLQSAQANPKAFQAELKETCPKFSSLLLEVAETINMGSRIWNAGGLPITLRLYEGVAYRVLYEVNDECSQLSHAFQAGLHKAQQQQNANDKGRVLRDTLDLIMGGPPSKPPGAR